MLCINCNNEDTKVLDSRPVNEGLAIRRRRACDKCDFRFSTREELEVSGLAVKKREGNRQLYDRGKIHRGLERAFEKLSYDEEFLRRLLNSIESRIIKASKEGEIESSTIGQIVMDRLKAENQVAYIRFASVYRQFADVDEFKKELKSLEKNNNN